jgi:hypothetical protein
MVFNSVHNEQISGEVSTPSSLYQRKQQVEEQYKYLEGIIENLMWLFLPSCPEFYIENQGNARINGTTRAFLVNIFAIDK